MSVKYDSILGKLRMDDTTDTSGFQPKVDNGLNTESKTIVGAINEIKAKVDYQENLLYAAL